MKLSLKPSLLDNAVTEGKFPKKRGAMSRIAEISGLNYQTVMKLAKGKFGIRLLSILGRYLSALGHKAKDVAEMRMGDVFDFDD